MLRHAIDLPLNPSEEKNKYNRFYSGAPSQTFYAFLNALKTTEVRLWDSSDVRRIFLLIARRGVGKGHFFAALQPYHPRNKLEDSRRLIEFLNTISPPETKWAGAAFFNLSFSLEVESVFDRLASFLWDCWAQNNPELETRFQNDQNDWEGLKNNRIERLDYIFRLYERHPPPYRILVAFNGINIIFDREGRAKNGQIQKLFEILIAHQFRELPIDLVFVCAENAIPEYFRTPPDSREARSQYSPEIRRIPLQGPGAEAERHTRPAQHIPEIRRIPLQELRRADIDKKSQRSLTEHNKLLRLNIVGDYGANFVHTLHEARASVLVNSFFPVVALIIARSLCRKFAGSAMEKQLGFPPKGESEKGISKEYANFFNLDTAKDTRVAFRNLLGEESQVHTKDRCLFKTKKKLFPQLMVAFAWAFEKSRYLPPTFLQIQRPKQIIEALAPRRCLDQPDELAKKLLLILGVDPCEPQFQKLIEEFTQVADETDKFTKRLYEDVGRGRFPLTLLLAAAYEIFFSAIPKPNEVETSASLAFNLVDGGVTTCLRFLERIHLDLENQHAPRRDDVVIEEVLQVYKTQHEIGGHIPLFGDISSNSTPLFIVQQQILWHLAVISVPVTVSLLAQCPLIRRALKECPEAREPGKNRILLKDIIRLLQLRCLIYRLKPRIHTESEEQDEEQVRYGIHRRLQRHIFSQMGAPFVEYPEVDQFSLTLYASQPNDIPRLSPRAHADLRKTVATLSGYPEDNQAIASFNSFNLEDRAPALRAAYGILRSVYSVAGVARFDVEHERIEDELTADGSLFGLGFFEEHRQQIRWVAEQAKKLVEDLAEAKKSGKVGDISPYTPFYAGEIVWLYNECGVLSFLQGRLPDAFALFDLALKALDYIEPDRDKPGPMRALVLLNQAVVDIERGRLRRAARTLTQILPVFSTADQEAILIAEGYLGVTHHLRGNFDKAGELYGKVILGLEALRKSRSASIFRRHHADLLRRRGGLDKAKAEVQAAIHLAQEGNHEDILHLAILSEVRIMIQQDAATSKPDPIHSRLDIVERYARVMGIPRMMAEVHEHRARLHLRSGDLRTAGTFARRSLEIASLHELQIRKANALVLYARINLDLGFRQACRPLLEEAMTLARDTEYYSVYDRAQEIAHDLKRSGDTQDFPVG